MRYPVLILALLFCVAGASPLPAAAPKQGSAEGDGPEPAARKAIQQQLRHRLPAARVAAFGKLKDFPPTEAAKLLVQTGLADRQPEVRRAAYQTLKTFRSDSEVGEFLLKSLEKHTRGQADINATAPLAAALLVWDSQEVRDSLRELLDAWLAKSKTGPAALIAVADELGNEADEQALESLQMLAQLKCFKDSFAFRRAVVQAFIRLHQPEAVGVLIEMLSSTDGEVAGDILRYLTRVTGRQLVKPQEWLAWWKEHKEGFKLPPEKDAEPVAGPFKPGRGEANDIAANRNLPLQDLVAGGTPSYYGISIHARRMVFVLDISGSMQGARIAAAKRELLTAINALPEDCQFNIVAFNHLVAVWQSKLMQATPVNKQGAARFVAYLNAGGMTATYDSLEAAFRLDVEAVYFLSDGDPTAGKIVRPQEILAAVGQANRARRISIYAIGIAPGAPGSRLDVFLSTLAEQNYGVYRRVDQ